MKGQTKKLTIIGVLCALAFVAVAVGRIPVVLFLKYDPKDVIITIGGFLFGPLTAFTVSLVVSLVELFTISDNGILGCIMNIISSCAFACTASFIYKKKHDLTGAVIGLVSGVVIMAAVMMLWNYLVTPLYMHVPRETVAGMLLPAFLPFNLIKGGLNAAITMLIYKPVVGALRRSNLIEESSAETKTRINVGVLLVTLMVIVTCVLLVLVLNGKF